MPLARKNKRAALRRQNASDEDELDFIMSSSAALLE